MSPRDAARFWGRVEKTDGCWLWRAGTNRGYGIAWVGGRIKKAHRVSWEEVNGPIPPGMFVCHRCDNPPCVRPSHLFLGTNADNMRDMSEKGRGYLRSPITAHDAIDIVSLYAFGATQLELARSYGITQSAVSLIVHGKNWSRATGVRR